MTRDQAIELLKKLQNEPDAEWAHEEADRVLCDLLKALGHEDVVAEFLKVTRWYS